MLKGKKISNKDEFDLVIGGFADGFGGVMFESEERRNSRKVNNTTGEGWTVDTCYAPDNECYETGIECSWINNGDWVIVDEYETKEEAEKGHKKWVEQMGKRPKKLYSVQSEEWLI